MTAATPEQTIQADRELETYKQQRETELNMNPLKTAARFVGDAALTIQTAWDTAGTSTLEEQRDIAAQQFEKQRQETLRMSRPILEQNEETQ